MKYLTHIVFYFALLLSAFVVCQKPFHEKLRPQLHFTPPKGWMNDPNGLILMNGEYHLFYQHDPTSIRNTQQSWGHAKSKDLIHWEHLPVALHEEDGIAMWSGTAIQPVDGNNTMVLLYAGLDRKRNIQTTNVAFSKDNGQTFTKYTGNPVIDPNLVNFRDPKIFYHEPGKYYVVVVVLSDRSVVRFHKTVDFIHYEIMSEFGPAGSAGGWECPDFFQMKVEGEQTLKDVLLVSNAGYIGYFVGQFNGTHFTNEQPLIRLDMGTDFYAAQTFNGLPNHRRVIMAWMANFGYVGDQPTEVWRGMQTYPREMSLQRGQDGKFKISSLPIVETVEIVNRTKLHANHLRVQDKELVFQDTRGSVSLLNAVVELLPETKGFDIKVLMSQNGSEYTAIKYDVATKMLSIDRSKSGNVDFSKNFLNAKSQMVVQPTLNKIDLVILVDVSTIEVFADGVAMSALVFPNADSSQGLSYVSQGVSNLMIFEEVDLNSMYPE